MHNERTKAELIAIGDKKVWIVRHGFGENEDTFTPLTEQGIDHAKKAAEFFSNMKLSYTPKTFGGLNKSIIS